MVCGFQEGLSVLLGLPTEEVDEEEEKERARAKARARKEEEEKLRKHQEKESRAKSPEEIVRNTLILYRKLTYGNFLNVLTDRKVINGRSREMNYINKRNLKKRSKLTTML